MSHEQKITKKVQTFRDLDVWRKGMDIAKEIYLLTEKLPKSELYGLVSQMRRAAVSLPSNIAEGFRRRNNKEFRQFLHIVLGSAAELETHIELCCELYRFDTDRENLLKNLNHFQAMTMNLIKCLNP